MLSIGLVANAEEPHRLISLDFCADQYLLAFADADQILGLSPDAEKSFSYYRDEASGFKKIRPRAEDIILAKPDAVIRTYGGGSNITRLMDRIGVKVIQINYASDLAGIRDNAITVATALGHPERGRAIANVMDKRLAAIEPSAPHSIFYLTSKGAVAGTDTLIDELIIGAGGENFQHRSGWGFAPLERLAYEQPDTVAASFFDGAGALTDQWSPSRHRIIKNTLKHSDVVELPGAWTACGAWFIVDAAEAMAANK